MDIEYFDRKNNQRSIEKVYGDAFVHFAYQTKIGLFLIQFKFIQYVCSSLLGWFYSSPISKSLVAKFIQKFSIQMELFETPPGGFRSFNQFFYRKLKSVLFPADARLLGSPCDARLITYPVSNFSTALTVKGKTLSIHELLGFTFKESNLGADFKLGTAWVFRLCPVDYHRFHFPDSGMIERLQRVPGFLHSVNPVAQEKLPEVFFRNMRDVAVLNTENFGKVIYSEVGAIGVGKIVQLVPQGSEFKRGDEKGYFEFGASTVILITSAKFVSVDEDIARNSAQGLETLVACGEKIGVRV